MKHFVRLGTMAAVAVLAVQSAALADISLYVSAPGIQSAETTTGIGGTLSTETFNSLSTGGLSGSFTSTGNGATYSSTGSVSIAPNGQYGGYNQGNYLQVNGLGLGPDNLGTVTLTFQTPINYFGMLWSAGDPSNSLSFYDASNNLIANYTTADLLTFLPKDNTTTKTALNGDVYYTGNYYGQPTANGPVAGESPSQNAANGTSPTLNDTEPYAYLHFYSGTDNPIISKIVLTTVNSAGNFESDNHTVSSNAVINGGTPVVLVNSSIPEPGTYALFIIGGLFVVLARRRLMA